MAANRKPAREVARHRSTTDVWIDHAFVTNDDSDWLQGVERLTLWNVALPPGFLARLSHLWSLDLRGGSGTDLSVAEGCEGLRFLCVNQVRGMHDLSMLRHFSALQLLMLYGLPKVEAIPSLACLTRLERAEIGQMRGLKTLAGLLQAPRLAELLLLRNVNVMPSDVDQICEHPSLQAFRWHAEDVPARIWEPVVHRIQLPKVAIQDAHEWIKQRKG